MLHKHIEPPPGWTEPHLDWCKPLCTSAASGAPVSPKRSVSHTPTGDTGERAETMSCKQYNDREQEAARLNISTRTLDRRCKEDGFPYVRLGNRMLFDPRLSDEYLAGLVHRGRAAELASS